MKNSETISYLQNIFIPRNPALRGDMNAEVPTAPVKKPHVSKGAMGLAKTLTPRIAGPPAGE
jgi:hypothetical protein